MLLGGTAAGGVESMGELKTLENQPSGVSLGPSSFRL